MKIIISPAKKMKVQEEFEVKSLPLLLNQTKQLHHHLKQLSVQDIAQIMKCNEKIAQTTSCYYQEMKFDEKLTPALFAYVGLQYQHMAPHVFTDEECDYVSKHLFILSGFYGILRPFDGIRLYRLEMQTKLPKYDLYDFWNDQLANICYKENDIVINLASKEYSQCIQKYLKENQQLITIHFMSEVNGKLKIKATEAKMARGAMVRYMATHQIEDIEKIKQFNDYQYVYSPSLSTTTDWVFIKK